MKKIVTAIGFATLCSMPALAIAADNIKFERTVAISAPVKVSKPFSELAKPLPTLTKERKFKLTASGEEVPGYGTINEIPNRFPFKDRNYKQPEGFVDTAAQTSMKSNKVSSLAPDLGVSFEGVGNVMGVAPPDTNGDVGLNHYVQTVNLAMAVWDKDGNQLMAPTATNALWSGFGGICETNNNGDPIVLYDSAADRWLISQFALNGTDNHECIAISTSGDPTSTYFLYDFAYGELMNDYPHFGIWTDGYYMGVNQFDPANGFAFAGGGVVAYERDKMLVGAVAQQVKFDMNGSTPTVFTAMPLDMDGLLPPPADTNEYFIWSSLDSLDNLQVWEFDVDWADTASATFTPVTQIDVTPYSSAPAITQPNGSSLDSLSIRSMFRAAYRNLNGQGKIVFTHNIAAPAGQGETAMRWYEIDVDQVAGTAALAQESTFAPDQTSRWMGSGAMDINGNIAFGYSMASPSVLPSIGAATRLATDPLNTLTDEVILKAGEGSQSGLSRWGDYSNMSIDPVDDCTFWFTTEYYKAESDNSTAWATNISSFKIPSCSAGPRGDISGTVTAADSGDAIPFATVSAGVISTKADSDGNYSITLPVGDYNVSASKYGFVASTPIAVTVLEDAAATSNLELAGAAQVVVSGNVSDGGGAAHALYAKISVSVPGDTLITFTNPETGDYSIPLFEGTTVAFTATEVGSSGYLSEGQDILPTNEAQTIKAMNGVDFSLTPNSNCTAAGYAFVNPAFFEGFDIFPADGWTVIQDDPSGASWDSYLASSIRISNIESDAALADSDAAGSGTTTDTSLISPLITVADLGTLVLQYDGFHQPFGPSEVTVDLSADGGAWSNVGLINPTTSLDPYAIDLSTELSGVTNFQIRFRYTAGWDWFTIVDNVRFGERVCEVVAGQLRSGFVVDNNTASPLVGAQISLDGELTATSVTTTEDEALTDGFFQVFVPDTAPNITVSSSNYATATPTAGEIALATPISLGAGLLTTDPETIEVNLRAGDSSSSVLTISNNGTAQSEFETLVVKGNSNSLTKGPFHPSNRHFGPKNLNDINASKIRHFPEINVEALAPGDFAGYFPTTLTLGWGISVDRNSGDFWIGDLAAGGAAADLIHRFDSEGNISADNIDAAFGGVFHADTAFNQRTGKLWSVNAGGDNCIHELDTGTLNQTGNTICPAFGTSERGLAYDPITNTFYSGSWTDSIIHQFTPEGDLIRSVNVGLPIAGLAFNAETNHLFVSANKASPAGEFDIFILDAATPEFVQLGGFDVQLDIDGDGVIDDAISDFGQAGLDIDCNGNLWIVEQNVQAVIGFESGETGVCDWNFVPWLNLDITNATIAVSESLDINVSVDTTSLSTGTYSATIIGDNNTPYGSQNVPVTLTVNEAQFGQLGFEVTSIEVNETSSATITVARTDGADFAVSIDYTTVDGTAISGQHFEMTSGTLNWEDLDTESKTFTVETMQFENQHEDLIFTVSLTNPQGGAIVANDSAEVTIVDLPNGDIGFAVTDIQVNENNNASITVERVGGADLAVSVDYSTADGSAIAGTHYEATSGTLSWDDQDTSEKTITVSTSDVDALVNFSITLLDPQGGAELNANVLATVSIADTSSSGGGNSGGGSSGGGGSLGMSLLLLFGLTGLFTRRRTLK